MTALSAETTLRHPRSKKDLRIRVGANVKIWKGAKCGIKDSFLLPISGTTGLKHFCMALETVDNTGGAAGDVSCDVEFATVKTLAVFINDTVAPVTADDIGADCYGVDDSGVVSASSSSGARSRVGTPWIIVPTTDALGQHPAVYVELEGDDSLTAADLESTTTGFGAGLVGYADAGSFTAATNVEDALDELYQDALSAQASIPINVYSFREMTSGGDVGNIAANGGVLASDTTPIMLGDANGSAEVQWATGNADAIGTSFMLPTDFDDTGNVTLDLILSSGTTDAATIGVATSWNGGAEVTDSADDSATKSATPHVVTATIATADVPVGSNRVSIRLTPPTHATNAISLYGARLNYKRKLRTA